MRTRHSGTMRAGFTLIEVLVTLLLLALLVAVTFPVITQQMDEADPTRAANDLANIRTGVDLFHLNVRPVYPGDLEDLVHQVSTAGDTDITGTAFSSGARNRWNGPYIDAALSEEDEATGDAIATGFNAQIDNELVEYDADANCANIAAGPACTYTATNQIFLAVQMTGLDATTDDAALQAINDLIDGEGESDTNAPAQGRFRWNDNATTGTDVAYYLAAPIS